MYNITVIDLVSLTCLQQSMTKIILKEIAKIAIVVTKSYCSILVMVAMVTVHLFASHKCCCDGQWPLTGHYFKCCSVQPHHNNNNGNNNNNHSNNINNNNNSNNNNNDYNNNNNNNNADNITSILYKLLLLFLPLVFDFVWHPFFI